ncbi:hypothetical protein [Oceanivirga salmonicida]|uniref:hypothetical protein n=1 Tax=Oceanivirga salmonicida TaxID=1769291 RepID=UPI00082D0C94|nr:hypothetical protein [Oceanivirga salmonicida]
MKKNIKLLLCSMSSIFISTSVTANDIINKYPSTFEKDDKIALEKDWKKVGNDIRKAMNLYGRGSN